MIEIKEVDQSGAVIDEKWERMRDELHKTRKAIKLALQQLINMRKEQVVYKIFLDKELGVDVDPDGLLPYKPIWKDRSCEKTYLKSELVSLVHHLEALDPKFRFDPECLPSALSTSREVLLTDKQMEDLFILYQNYNVYRSENERKAAEAFRDYLKMRNEYEDKLLHNNAMIDEINDIRKRIKELKTQAIEDKCLMKFLVTFKLYKEKPIGVKSEKSKCTPSSVMGRAGQDDVPLLPWPPRSPDIIPCDFFLWGYVRDKVYVPPMPTTLQALKERIAAAVTDIHGNMLLNVWTELDYRWDVCRVTKCAHIEHL
ncbi:hypothetical protein AVEN_88080-1 [Araneus ventricosus]|uniref:Uncharacterized protein n=1 Tax=Araneus ventricosus TaxID=182803 RepID=A0A4Y2R2T9_ARAVE|nr:hypothetical protein AVEN_233966-1 [Araneus ventricosus]GBN69770.1 hypothetical protein AVEN_88080-1 [Araneus ventricosus]